MIPCEVCDQPAVVRVQFDSAAGGFSRDVPVCQAHADGWYVGEDSDYQPVWPLEEATP
jgi:hypothetical protein